MLKKLKLKFYYKNGKLWIKRSLYLLKIAHVIILIEDFDFGNILIDEKSHKNFLVYDTSCKPLLISKPLRIRFDE